MIGIIDYGLGNLASVSNALKKLGISNLISSDINLLNKSAALIFPGVGAAGPGMAYLKSKGLDKFIIEQAQKGTPVLGICLGMQLLLTESEEGNTKCLNLIKGTVKKFQTKLKVPEIGWNRVKINIKIPRPSDTPFTKGGKGDLFFKIPDNSYFYFVNSYYCEPEDKNVIAGVTDYDGNFCSILIKENIIGVQFHPEKSGEVGLQMLKNFCTLSSRPER